MARPRKSPSEGEIDILRVLWEHGPSTVRQVHERRGGKVGYTTTLKALQTMFAKGLVRRDTSGRAHVYRAHQPEKTTLRRLTRDLYRRAFGKSYEAWVLEALAVEDLPPETLQRIRKLLAEAEAKSAKKREPPGR